MWRLLPPLLRATTAALKPTLPLARLPLLPRAVPLVPALPLALLPETVDLAVSRASQAQLKAVQVQAQADLRALQPAQGFLISVPGGQLVPGDQLAVTLMPLLKPRLLPKLLVL